VKIYRSGWYEVPKHKVKGTFVTVFL